MVKSRLSDGDMDFEVEMPPKETVNHMVIGGILSEFDDSEKLAITDALHDAYTARAWLPEDGDSRVFDLMAECYLRGAGLWPDDIKVEVRPVNRDQ